MTTETTTPTSEYDPFDAAMTAEPLKLGPKTVFGEMEIDTWPCILVKGTGKVQFDPMQHDTDQRRTAIDLRLIPTKGEFNYERNLIAESNEWAKIVLPSLKALGTDLRSLNGRFVEALLVPTGQTYEDKNTGEKKDRTTFKFIRVFGEMDECFAAADEFFASRRGGNGSSQAAPAPAPASTEPATLMEKDTALKFLQPLWSACKGDRARFLQQLAGNSLLNKHFNETSPEVTALFG